MEGDCLQPELLLTKTACRLGSSCELMAVRPLHMSGAKVGWHVLGQEFACCI